MVEREVTLTLVNKETLHQEDGFGVTFLRGLAYSTIQNPINGAAQLADKTLGTNSLPKVQLIDAPDSTSESNGVAGKLGGLVGTGIHCFGMMAIGGRLAGSELTVAGFKHRALTTGAMGALYGGVLTPVGNDEGNFWRNRAENTLIGATGLAAMSVIRTVTGDMGLPREAIQGNSLGRTTFKPMAVFVAGATAEILAPRNWSRVEWWPAVREPDAPAPAAEEIESNRLLFGVFLGNKVRPVSELQR